MVSACGKFLVASTMKQELNVRFGYMRASLCKLQVTVIEEMLTS